MKRVFSRASRLDAPPCRRGGKPTLSSYLHFPEAPPCGREASFLLLVLLLQACTTADKENIEGLLVQRAEAFQKKNLALYLSCISKDYQDKEEDFERLKNRVSGHFETFDRMDYNALDRSIQVEGQDATALQPFRIEVEKKGNKNPYAGREVLRLRKEGEEWKMISGL